MGVAWGWATLWLYCVCKLEGCDLTYGLVISSLHSLGLHVLGIHMNYALEAEQLNATYLEILNFCWPIYFIGPPYNYDHS